MHAALRRRGRLRGLTAVLRFVDVWRSVVPEEARAVDTAVLAPFVIATQGKALAELDLLLEADVTNTANALRAELQAPWSSVVKVEQKAAVLMPLNAACERCGSTAPETRVLGGRSFEVRYLDRLSLPGLELQKVCTCGATHTYSELRYRHDRSALIEAAREGRSGQGGTGGERRACVWNTRRRSWGGARSR